MSCRYLKIEDFCSTGSGGTPSRSKPEYYEGGDIPWIKSGDLKDSKIYEANEYITAAGLENSSAKIVEKDSILIAMYGATVGRLAILGINAATNQAICNIRPDTTIADMKYLYYFLKSKFSYFVENAVGGAQPNISQGLIKSLEVPLPSLDEQKRIADILDKAAGVCQKREQAIKLADDFLRATFLEMFGDPIENPKGWNVKPLADQIVHANNGISRRRKEDTNEGDIVLRLQDVHYSGIAFDKELNRIKLVDKEKQIARVEHDDLLFIRVNGNPNYVGRTAVFKSYIEPVYHNDHLIRIKLDNEYQSDFLCYLINSPFSRKLIAQQIKTSAGQHTISQDGILKLMFYRPPIELQEKFINIKNKIESIFYRKDKHEDLFASISNKLIHSIK
ncbi:TPA: restriction endonuclease subunit S [Escherichia coli]|uniref:restriction endonuclease subunit S n=2 Tax=Escherichia coli TaxID=562 RepID=UPI000BE57772|nr:restriction endonuclease subunit S [Escherichia coli]EES4558632.1 restriction endonuclease subunit S [Escherichia coli]EEV6587112.1 restriction endonuclease subunit S [Escherichia coli]EFK0933791.1 restriction endonuclease subunit S [Escherichia coli]ELN6767062.1 restriction endonuclease subunit S [Escherichia coli]ELY9238437.1 restriction endonuclease subunit S [Escherichia coli]